MPKRPSADWRRMRLAQIKEARARNPAPAAAAAAAPASLADYCARTMRTERGAPYVMSGRRSYLAELVQDPRPGSRTVITKGRQVGASTLIAAHMLWFGLRHPRSIILYVADTLPHARDYARLKLRPILRDVGIASQIPAGDDLVMQIGLPGGSRIILMGAYGGYRQSRSYSADMVVLDEAQSTELSALPTLLESMSQSGHDTAIIAGTGAPEGSEWERLWLSTDMREWSAAPEGEGGEGDVDGAGRWEPRNPGAAWRGYHISQEMMPNWSPEREAARRREYSAAQYTMEVVGGFAAAASVPLTVSEARACYHPVDAMPMPTDPPPAPDCRIIASLDLAHGGGALTVITISAHDPAADMLHVLHAEAYDDDRNGPLAAKIASVLDDWRPDAVVSDVGGNKDLLQRLRDSHAVLAVQSSGTQVEALKYGHVGDRDMITASKSYMMDRALDRWHARRISIPEHPDTIPWTVEHATAERAETVRPAGGAAYVRYDRQPGRQDDFLQTLMFAECLIYAAADPQNPRNAKAEWAVGD